MRQKLIDRLREIARHHRERIPRNVVDAARPEMDNHVAGVLVGTFARKRIIGDETGLERIGPIMNGRRGGGAQNSGDSRLNLVDLTAARLVLSRDSFSANTAFAAQGWRDALPRVRE
jgi:hypothetical protein